MKYYIVINDVGDLLFHYDDKKATFQQWIRHMEDNIEHFISTQLPTVRFSIYHHDLYILPFVLL